MSTKIVGIKRETIDLNAAPGMHRTTTQAFGWLASKCTAKATKFAAFFVGTLKQADSQLIMICGKAVLVRHAAQFRVTLTAQHNVVKVDTHEKTPKRIDHVTLSALRARCAIYVLFRSTGRVISRDAGFRASGHDAMISAVRKCERRAVERKVKRFSQQR